ncbi:MAG: hypothetical protein Q4E91_10675, partial [Lachnospiraceae bacterium]|nr:hypothetical protein [Lachnospiraceae bacterium]
MPDYKRFIAYFYEYIGGRRQRNAGFLKAECRGGTWRLQIQLRAGRWPEGGLQIYGYVDEGKRCPLILLGKAYAQKEYLTKRLQLEAAALASNGLPFENLSGIWIPCEEQRCYISHWLEGEIQPERLSLQEEPPAEEAKQPEKDVKSEEGASAGEDRTTEERPEADLKEQRPLEQEPAGQETEKLPEGEKAAELYAEEITEAAPEPERVPEKDPAEAARQEPEGNPAE